MNSKIKTNQESEESKRLAVLIDADNAQADAFEYLLQEIAKYGDATVKRIYGDFTSTQNRKWKAVLNQYAIKPVQQFAYTKGKNATDSSMIIDAMDLLYTQRFDGFCIVSSDSDFTGLAMRIREQGLSVYGCGRETTPESFKQACHRFIETEILLPKDDKAEKLPSKNIKPQRPIPKLPIKLLNRAIEESSDDNGWAHLSSFGRYINKIQTDFDSRKYGYKKLGDLVKDRKDLFEIEIREGLSGGGANIYVRAK